MALVGNILLGTGAAPGMSSIASAYAESAASSRIPWSALEYSGQTITAISGSAIGGQGGGGGVTPADVSAIASSYANDKLDKSASSTFAPTGNYAYESSLSSKLDASASSDFAPAGDYAYNSSLSGYVPKSGISAQSAVWDTVTGKADATAVHTYTGVSPIVVDNSTDLISLSATAVHLDSSLRTYNSGESAMVGLAYPTVIVGNSSQATANNVIYIVTGSN